MTETFRPGKIFDGCWKNNEYIGRFKANRQERFIWLPNTLARIFSEWIFLANINKFMEWKVWHKLMKHPSLTKRDNGFSSPCQENLDSVYDLDRVYGFLLSPLGPSRGSSCGRVKGKRHGKRLGEAAGGRSWCFRNFFHVQTHHFFCPGCYVGRENVEKHLPLQSKVLTDADGDAEEYLCRL